MNRVTNIFALVLCLCLAGAAQSPAQDQVQAHGQAAAQAMSSSHDHDQHKAASPPVTFADLETTAAQLEKARRATEKYRNVQEAEADGYQAIGPDVRGMGIHYVHVGRRPSAGPQGFDVEHPEILLYEKDAASPGGYALVGVSYLFNAESDSDGQPKNPPFPRSLASWHRHSDLCVLPDRSVKGQLNADQCKAQGGQFTALTQWMVHAWIWKDSPAGVFSDKNPTVQ